MYNTVKKRKPENATFKRHLRLKCDYFFYTKPCLCSLRILYELKYCNLRHGLSRKTKTIRVIYLIQALYCYFILLYITLFYFIFTWVKNLLDNHSFYFILLYFTLFQLQSTDNRLFYY